MGGGWEPGTRWWRRQAVRRFGVHPRCAGCCVVLQALLGAGVLSECSEGSPRWAGGGEEGLGLHPHLDTVAWETSPAASAQHRASASR